MVATSALIGTSMPHIEGPDKVSGRARYAADVTLPGMLWGKVLRSPYPHARIVRIDTTRARQVPGVHAVVTGRDVEGHTQGKVIRDMPVLCWDRVRYVGDRVAAVAAETLEAAETALRLIDVEYEQLPAVFDPLKAMQPDAPLLHGDISQYATAVPITRQAPPDLHNGATRLYWSKGDVEQGFRESDHVFEHTFTVPSRHQGYLEPYASVVDIQADGRVHLWSSNKAPFRVRQQLALAVGISEEQVLVNPTFVGGDFGGKGDARDLPIAYFLARAAGRPVKIVMTYKEELEASNPTHHTVLMLKTGVKHDGTIMARQLRVVHACGAYAALKPNAALSSWHYVGGGYRVEHASWEFLQIYTNTTPGGYFRAPGAHQYTFAIESQTDMIARALSIDPAEYRLRHLLIDGDRDGTGNELRRIRARDVLQAALQAADWDEPKPGVHVGRGIGMFGRQIGGGKSGAVLTAELDGSFTALSPTVDMGVGTHTVVKQMVAAEMGVPYEHVEVVIGDTDHAPFDEGPRASRVTYTEGRAVLMACEQLKAKLTEGAAWALGCQPTEVAYRDGALWAGDRRVELGRAAAAAGNGRPVTVTVEYDAPQREDTMYFCAQVAEVEVDPETGAVKLRRLVTAHDVGTIINPMAHQGQIDGGVMTGIGLALTEELLQEDGRIQNLHLGEYKLPTASDLPELVTVLVPSAGGVGPYEATAIGELANNGTPAAVANAVADAVNARLFELPVTAERVYHVLKQAGQPA